MKMKEGIGICIGIVFIILAVVSFGILSKDEQKGRTQPVLQYTWEKAVFDDQMVQNVLKELDIEKISGFLFQKDSRTPMYFAVYIGKSPKGKEAVKKYFANSTKFPQGFKAREEAALKILGEKDPVVHSGKDLQHKIELNYSGDYVIVSYAPQSTNVVLDEPQQTHFIHRYFQKKLKAPEKK